MARDGTLTRIFPEGLAIGSSFDLDLVQSIYAAAAAEAWAVGLHMLSTLVLEFDRDPRMGRNQDRALLVSRSSGPLNGDLNSTKGN